MDFLLIFFTGLTTGGLSCLAVQGGLLASIISNQKKQELENDPNSNNKNHKLKEIDSLDWMPVLLFLVAKLISHTILGFILGLAGSFITLSLDAKLFFQAITAIFMFASAMNLMNIHPIFRYLSFQPPKWIRKMIKGNSKKSYLFAPFVLGLMTIFIPCGVTQAMEVLAINSGNPFIGAATMFAFVLGTMPLFAILGIATAKLSETWNSIFSKVAGYALILMAVYTLNGVLVVMNSPITVQKITQPITYFFSNDRFEQNNTNTIAIKDGVQIVNIKVLSQGYSPSYTRVKKGVPVELTLTSNGTYSCALSFVFREFGIRASLKSTDQQTFTFTPNKVGRHVFTCSMGMYSGILEVVE